MNDRIARLRGELDSLGAATFLATNSVNVRYLTGFDSSNAAVLVDGDRVLVATDGRYTEAARRLEGVELVEADRDIFSFLGTRLGELVESPIAFEADYVTVAAHGALSANGSTLVPAKGVVLGLRAVKEDAELDAIRAATRVTSAAYERLAQESVVGRTEADVAWWFEKTLRDEGADGLAFPTIVAAGPNAALPHHHPGDRKIGPGETMIVDAGALVDGYCSDCTRTFATGELPELLQQGYDLCRSAAGARAGSGASRRHGGGARCDRPRRDRGVGPRARAPRARPRRRPGRPRAPGPAAERPRTRSSRATSSRSSRASTSPAWAASGSRISSSSARTGPRC